jgi:hypothetical protein
MHSRQTNSVRAQHVDPTQSHRGHRAMRGHSSPSHSVALQQRSSPNRRTTLTSKDVNSAQQKILGATAKAAKAEEAYAGVDNADVSL